MSVLNGSWINEDQELGNITRINIGVEGNSATVEQFGRCIPTDCPFGAVEGNTSQWGSLQVLNAFWDHGFAHLAQTDAESYVLVSESGLVTAIVGDESVEGGGDATLASLRANESDGPNLLVNLPSSFDLLPANHDPGLEFRRRRRELPAGYGVRQRFPDRPLLHGPRECGVWTQQTAGSTTTPGLMHT